MLFYKTNAYFIIIITNTEAALRSFCLCRNTARVEAAFLSFYEAAASENSSIGLHVSPKLRQRLRKTEAAFCSLVET